MWKVHPEWASDLTLSFTEFDTEEDKDVLKIYDGSNNQLLATYSGEYTAGNMPDPITIPSGNLFLYSRVTEPLTVRDGLLSGK